MELPFGLIRTPSPLIHYPKRSPRASQFPSLVQFVRLACLRFSHDRASLIARVSATRARGSVDLSYKAVREKAKGVSTDTRNGTSNGRAAPRTIHIDFPSVFRRQAPLRLWRASSLIYACHTRIPHPFFSSLILFSFEFPILPRIFETLPYPFLRQDCKLCKA